MGQEAGVLPPTSTHGTWRCLQPNFLIRDPLAPSWDRSNPYPRQGLDLEEKGDSKIDSSGRNLLMNIHHFTPCR